MLLLGLAWVLRTERWRLRATAILGAVLLATACEALLAARLGWPPDLAELARAVAAGSALGLVLDAVLALARRTGRRWGGAAGIAACLALMAIPRIGPAALHARLAIPAQSETVPTAQPPVVLITGLPLVWGETDRAIVGGAPSAIYSSLRERFAIEPGDTITPARGATLLLAQPRPPGPAGLVAIDRWVREGGRALILTDPALRWPSGYPLGDPRRPPLEDGLGPLLAHWGLRLEPAPGQVIQPRDIGSRRIVFASPGRFVKQSGACVLSQAGLIAECRIGRGNARLVADADWLRDALWVGPGPRGATRARRLADNGPWLEDMLGNSGEQSIPWIKAGANTVDALLIAGSAPFALLLLALGTRMFGRASVTRR